LPAYGYNAAETIPNAGLLSPDTLAGLPQDAMHHRAGCQLLDVAEHIQVEGIPPLSDKNILAELKAVPAERRIRRPHTNNTNNYSM